MSYLESSTVYHMTRTLWAAFCLLKFQIFFRPHIYAPCSVENKVKLLEAPHVIKILHWILIHRVIHLTIIQTDISVLHQIYGEGRAKTTPIEQKGLGALYSFQSGSTNGGSAYRENHEYQGRGKGSYKGAKGCVSEERGNKCTVSSVTYDVVPH